MTQTRYIFATDPEPHVVELVGVRRPKTVRVTSCRETGYRTILPTDYWDTLPVSPQMAQNVFVSRMMRVIQNSNQRILDARKDIARSSGDIRTYKVISR